MGGQSEQSAAASQAQAEEANAGRYMLSVAIPAERGLLGYIDQALAGGEPGYVKQGYQNLRQQVSDEATIGQAQKLSQTFTGGRAPQGGAAIRAIGDITTEGAGHRAAGMAAGSLSEAGAMLQQTNNLLNIMSGQSGTGIGQAVEAGGLQARAIGMLRPYNPTTANVLGLINAGAAVYGGLNSGATGATSPDFSPLASAPASYNFSGSGLTPDASGWVGP